MFSELLKKYRKKNNLTQKMLADKASLLLERPLKTEHISAYEKGTNPKIEVIVAIAEILKIPEQFLFDDSTDKISKIVSSEITNYKRVIENTLKIPLLDGYIGAGSSGIIEHINKIDYLYIDKYSINKAFKNNDIKALEVIGDSMTPYINASDIILFSPIPQGQYNLTDGKYIIETINGIMVKNLSFKTNGNIVISSCNKSYPSEEINKNESQEVLDIIGIVIGRILKS